MILQTDTELNTFLPGLADTGCTAMLPFWTANKYNGLMITRELIVYKLSKWIDEGFITDEYYINYWGAIHRDLGLNVVYHGHVSPSAVIANGQFAYGYWESKSQSWYHFTALDNAKNITYDPLGLSTIGDGTLLSLRLFTML